ncbi:MAG TPA: dTDP-glucose 4,6-dehydratase [Gammaproteobacteria bacterium]|nr:dTDP-glucose 4,6-dehydratase [Gammaproteobacteria bacterium]
MNDYMPQTMLVTGGAGFIGSHFIRYALKAHPHLKIVNLDILSYAGSLKNLELLPDANRHEFVVGNICDSALVSHLLSKYNIDTIVHFAAESHVDRSITGPAAFIETNLNGTFILLEAARQYWLNERQLKPDACRFHHVSTDEVYGTLSETDPPFTELTPYAPNSPYSASKAGSDHLVRAYYETYHLPVTISNCSNNYGTYQHPEKFIPTVIRSCLNWQPIPVYGNGKNRRDWLYVEDHCSAIDKVIRQGTLGAKYNVGGECEVENLKLAKEITHIMDKLFPKNNTHESLISFVTDRPGHDWRYAMDIRKISSELQWFPETSLEDGLLKTIKWYAQESSANVARSVDSAAELKA